MIACVGDSNMLLGATALLAAVHQRGIQCAVVFLARPGQGIDGWEQELAALPQADLYFVNLGINDALAGRYDNWLARARTFRASLDGPVVWSNLPWEIEPVARRDGSLVVNDALVSLDVTVADWASDAHGHPEWLDGVHFTGAGAKAWAGCVVDAIERAKAPQRAGRGHE